MVVFGLRLGMVISVMVSLPFPCIGFRKLIFGAGNLHINIVANRWDPAIEAAIEPWIYEATGTSFAPPHFSY